MTPAAAPHDEPAQAGLFVGRQTEMQSLAAELRSPGCVVAVVGEAGIGKTSLIRQTLYDVEDRAAVYVGGALATLQWTPYLPLKLAFRRPGSAPPPASFWHGDAEFVADGIESTVGAGVVVLDDMQWADPNSWAVVSLLARRVRLVTAVRRGDPAAESALRRLAELGAVRLDVGPLDRADALALAQHARRDLGSQEVESIVARAGGNPLLIEELAAGNVDSLKRAMAARLDALPRRAADDLEMLALAGRALPTDLILSWQTLRRAGVAEASGDDVAIRHALLADVIIEAMADDRRVAVHRRLAESLTDPGSRAQHHHAAGDHGQAYAAALVAAEAATTPGERAAHLTLAAACASPSQGPVLMLRAAWAAVEAGDFDAVATCLDKIDGSAAPFDSSAGAEAALLRARVLSEIDDRHAWQRHIDEVVRNLPSIASDHGEPSGEGAGARVTVLLLAEQARATLMAAGDVPTAVARARAAVARARAPNGYAEYVLGTALYYAGDPDWREHLMFARELARRDGDLVVELRAANNLVSAHEGAGDPAVGRRIARSMVERADDLRLLRWKRHFWAAELNLAMHAGDYRTVARSAPTLLAGQLMRRTRDEVTSCYALSLLNLGRLDDGVAAAEATLPDSELCLSNLFHLRAIAAWYGGDDAAALAEWPAFRDSAENAHRLALAAPIFAHAARACAAPQPDLPDLATACEVPALHAVPHELAAIRDGEPARAASGYATAARLWAPYHRQGEVRCRWQHGVALAAAGDTAAAATALAEAELLAARHHMAPMTALIERSLRSIGVRRGGLRTAGPITSRQAEILGLVRHGLTDASIAARLGLSTRTVQTHIAAARGKLGAANRQQAALMAENLGVDAP